MDVKFHNHAENPLLYAKFTALSFIEPELMPIEFYIVGRRNFAYFFAKNSGKY